VKAHHSLPQNDSIGLSFCFLVNFLLSDNFPQKSNNVELHLSQIVEGFWGFRQILRLF